MRRPALCPVCNRHGFRGQSLTCDYCGFEIDSDPKALYRAKEQLKYWDEAEDKRRKAGR